MKSHRINDRKLERLQEEFAEMIEAKGYCKGWIYGYCIKEFLWFIENKGISNIKKVKTSDIIAFYEYLKERPNERRGGLLSDTAIRQHLYSLRLFFDHLIEIKEIENSPARVPSFQFNKREEKQVLTVNEIKLLYKHTVSRFERAVLALAYGCGLRYSELRNLDVADVLFHKGVINVRGGKNNKSREVPMSAGVMKDLKEYLIYERIQRVIGEKGVSAPAFLLNKDGGRFGGETINNYYLKRLAQRTGSSVIINKGVHLHALRHAIATHLIEGGAPIEFVKRFLGHTMLDTTTLYCKRRKLKSRFMNQGLIDL